jgi:hypothetical protein
MGNFPIWDLDGELAKNVLRISWFFLVTTEISDLNLSF